MTAFMTF